MTAQLLKNELFTADEVALSMTSVFALGDLATGTILFRVNYSGPQTAGA
ncbi:hypothetical protein [Deinococcus sp. QL22]|nr:hypothetical protein [Deinococcus sp. QL22]UQN09377.1 hypothetical protein M1R55_22725 [Deinococcus sp. QL22]